MNYPSISNYIEALHYAEENLNELKDLRLVYDDRRHPVMSSGNFAVVFKMQSPNGAYYALKCFLRDQDERDERYRLIAEELQYVQSSYLVSIKYLERELFVDVPGADAEEYPVLLMDWVDGIPLDQYIKRIDNVYDRYLLAYRFSLLARWLVAQPFAHGDLKPDNISVRADGSLVLLDYDGMYVPALAGRQALEQGSPHYRHPQRSKQPFDAHIDDYTLALILLSLRVISLDYNLYRKCKYTTQEYLLLSEQDQAAPYTSTVFQELSRLVLQLDLIDIYHCYLSCWRDPFYHITTPDCYLLAPIAMLRQATEVGDTEGMWRLGECYYQGSGVDQDYAEAARWYRKAAEAGNSDGMLRLGECYYDGRGVDQDYVEAVHWYRKAAEAGDSDGMWLLGKCYYYGEGIDQDEAEAAHWYRKSAEAGNTDGMWRLGYCYYYGRGVYLSYEMAAHWYRKSAEAGNSDGMLLLGNCYNNGWGVDKDKAEAERWYSLL